MEKYTLKELMQEYSTHDQQTKMTQKTLQKIVTTSKDVQVLKEEVGYVLFEYLGTKMALYPDENFNRMRLISPITAYSNLAPNIKNALMDANFHSSLDCRYGVDDDSLYVAYLHPLSSLAKEDFLSALKQVHNLAKSFRKTYSSAQIAFIKKK